MAILESYCALDFFTGRKPFIPFIVLHQPPVQGGIGLSPKFAKLQSRGKIEEAVTEMEQAARLDPLSPPINHHLAFTYFSNGRYDDALEQIDRILESDSTHRASIELQGLCLLMKGEIEKAIETLEQYQALTGSDAKGVTPLDFAYAKAGRIEDARNCLPKLEKRQQQETQELLFMDFVVLYIGLGDFDKAYYHLEKALEARLGGMIF